MTRTLAAEWGRFGIRVNAVAPGPIHTEGTDANLWSVADVEEAVRSSVPLGRLGEPADVARAVLWLCSGEAQWISGATLSVDGAQWLHGGTLDFRRAFDAMKASARQTGIEAPLPGIGAMKMAIDYSHAPHAWEKERGNFVLLLDLQLESVERGKAVMRMPFRPEITNGTGAVHGGAIVSLCDTAVLRRARVDLRARARYDDGRAAVQLSRTGVAAARSHRGGARAQGRTPRSCTVKSTSAAARRSSHTPR